MEKTEVVSIFLLSQDDEILLYRKHKSPIVPKFEFPDTWDVLGWCVGKDENPDQRIRHEMQKNFGMFLSPPLWRTITFPFSVHHVFVQVMKMDVNNLNKKLNLGQRVCLFSLEEVRSMQLAHLYEQYVIEYLEQRKRNATLLAS